MIFGFIKKLVKYYIDKFVSWLRLKKIQLELDNEIKKYHDDMDVWSFDIGTTTSFSASDPITKALAKCKRRGGSLSSSNSEIDFDTASWLPASWLSNAA